MLITIRYVRYLISNLFPESVKGKRAAIQRASETDTERKGSACYSTENGNEEKFDGKLAIYLSV